MTDLDRLREALHDIQHYKRNYIGDEDAAEMVDGMTKIARAALAAAPSGAERGGTCQARKSVGANDPQDRDWPVCGCDPLANKVIEALTESGALSSEK